MQILNSLSLSPSYVQGRLFALDALPRQPRSYKSELEEDFLPPRERRSASASLGK